ncbi:helix-turn-helix domain-containing protein [Actinomadura litoris]|uniref:Helix-turn-helix domain-containing protein n=1 Tax=Actinomadura litoris TaxID=2678616 RepID=A0A7K1L3A2_9ACTN|nr:AraC family transcriptional regulator [Actinomadura litoris]MUN38879.1 helix-turn-helix domain-containing protein [Actinomadura litoris]
MSALPLHHIEVPAPSGTAPLAIGSFPEIGSYTTAGFAHRHDFYEVLHITGGSGTHVVDFVHYQIKPPVMYFLSPGQVHFWDCETPLQGRVLVFTEDFMLGRASERGMGDEPPCFDVLSENAELRLDAAGDRAISDLLVPIEQEYHRREAGHTCVSRAYLNILLVTAYRMRAFAPATAEHRSSALARRFVRLAAEHDADEPSVRAYADKLGVTASHLTEVVKQATGRTPGQVIRGALALEAKRMLALTELNAAQVASALGFTDPSYFGRFFKRETGVSPLGFRRVIREKYQNAREMSL